MFLSQHHALLLAVEAIGIAPSFGSTGQNPKLKASAIGQFLFLGAGFKAAKTGIGELHCWARVGSACWVFGSRPTLVKLAPAFRSFTPRKANTKIRHFSKRFQFERRMKAAGLHSGRLTASGGGLQDGEHSLDEPVAVFQAIVAFLRIRSFHSWPPITGSVKSNHFSAARKPLTSLPLAMGALFLFDNGAV